MAGEPRGAHLVGSVPLADAEAVFRTAGALLGDRLRRIPDGETGVRTNWIGWQFAVFQVHPELELVPPDPENARFYGPRPSFRLRPGAGAAGFAFGPLGYAAAARESWATFARLQGEGAIPAGARFQISLPTPLAPVISFIHADSQAALEPRYEARLLAELDEILALVPAERRSAGWGPGERRSLDDD